jgi:hypothetical protein
MSYANLILYGATLPSYNKKKRGKGDSLNNSETINADDPRNNDKIIALISEME